MLARYCSLRVSLISIAGLSSVVLAAVGWITSEYGSLAKKINWEWLDGYPPSPPGTPISTKRNGRCDDPIVLVTKWGEEVIGALVLRFVKKERKGYVRAWTVKSDDRRKEIGSELLEYGVRVCWGKGARAVEFDERHASRLCVLFWS